MTEEKTYKAVFVCKALNERRVWYVSSRREGRRHLRWHVGSTGSKTLAAYKANDWVYMLKPVFETDNSAEFDVVHSSDAT